MIEKKVKERGFKWESVDKLCCLECLNDEFKKEYTSEQGYIYYCTRCGRILLNSDIYGEEYDSWKDRNYRPNAWNDCYVNCLNRYW